MTCDPFFAKIRQLTTAYLNFDLKTKYCLRIMRDELIYVNYSCSVHSTGTWRRVQRGPLTDEGRARSLAAMRARRQRWLEEMRAKKAACEKSGQGAEINLKTPQRRRGTR
jgi:hypothetical protein